MGLLSVVLLAIGTYASLILLGIYQIKQGEVGLIKQFGVLKKDLVEPGIHFRIYGYQDILRLNLMIQTDKVEKVPCGTANGLLVYFDKIEVVNRLEKRHVYRTVLNYTEAYEKIWITDKIHHQINQFCSKHTLQEIYIDLFDKLDEALMKALNQDLSKWAPGIEILSVRITKPDIPKKILQNVQEMERVKIQFLIAQERQKVQIEQRKTNQTQKRIKAESNLAVKKIELKKQLQKKKNQLEMAKIQGKIILEKEKTIVETQFLAALEQASLYSQLFTQDYLKYLAADALTSNLTLTAGDRVPNIIGDLLTKKRKV